MANDEARRYGTEEMLAEEAKHVCVEGQANALCFSGGGIRSASFCLGVAQALAKAGLLKEFHYLSTVSGGGYIGGWLQQLILEKTDKSDPPMTRIGCIEEELCKPAPAALQRLRNYTNFLTPQTGIGSADTWAGIALYLRNLGLTWLVLLPVFLVAALLPIMHRTLIWAVGQYEIWAGLALLGASGLLSMAVYLACAWLPSHRATQKQGAGTPQQQEKYGHDQANRCIWIVVGALGWAALLPIALQFLLLSPDRTLFAAGFGSWGMWLLPLAYVLTMWVAYGMAWRVAPDGDAKDFYAANSNPWGVASLGSGLVLLLLLKSLWSVRDWLVVQDGVADVLTLAAPILSIFVLLTQTTFYLGIRARARENCADLDREWLARLNGIVLGIAMAWTLFSAACLMIPKFTLPDIGTTPSPDAIRTIVAGVGALVSGFMASWAGKQVTSQVQSVASKSTDGPGKTLELAMKVLPPIFIVAVFGFMGTILQYSLGYLQTQIWTASPAELITCFWFGPDEPPGWPYVWCHPPLGAAAFIPFGLQFAALLILGFLIYRLERIINVNRFSLHALYRNRLTRAFLGTLRDTRAADPFTGFDETDDKRLKDFAAPGGQRQRLYPVINMTVNITTGAPGAWSERQGASFIATPLFCGSNALGEKLENATKAVGAFIPTKYFAGKGTELDKEDMGTRLGSMMAASGAAASPHWGYHSSPPIAFLMTLFNVRLGIWYPNPAQVGTDAGAITADSDIQLAKPRNSLAALLGDLMGASRADSQAIYLSDGGHFDNLAVYEMIRRRCKHILVLDAGEDAGCTFFDLGMMIRKAEIDMPVRITFGNKDIRDHIAARTEIEKAMADRKETKDLTGFAYGKIEYLDQPADANTGTIIYIKPTLLPNAPAGMWSYAKDSVTFPHESTADQWFSESQFESYRTLGYFQAKQLLQKSGQLGTPSADLGYKTMAELFAEQSPD